METSWSSVVGTGLGFLTLVGSIIGFYHRKVERIEERLGMEIDRVSADLDNHITVDDASHKELSGRISDTRERYSNKDDMEKLETRLENVEERLGRLFLDGCNSVNKRIDTLQETMLKIITELARDKNGK